MSTDDADSPEHRTAIKQLARARENALEAIHRIRAGQYNRKSANLIQVADNPRRDRTHAAADATGWVCDYLTHLRPFGSGTETWQTELGLIELPKKIQGDSPGLKRGGGASLRCTRMPYINITDMGAAIRAGNAEIVYAEGGGSVEFTPKRARSNGMYRVQGHDLTEKGHQQLRAGHDLDECEHAVDRLAEVSNFEPASRGGNEEEYQFVYTSDQLLTLYEVADEIAASENLLANIKTQGTTDNSGF